MVKINTESLVKEKTGKENLLRNSARFNTIQMFHPPINHWKIKQESLIADFGCNERQACAPILNNVVCVVCFQQNSVGFRVISVVHLLSLIWD